MEKGFLFFELSPHGQQLQLYGDRVGLRRLSVILERLAANDESEHEQLITAEWGGDDLSGEVQGVEQGDRLINQFTIHCWVQKS